MYPGTPFFRGRTIPEPSVKTIVQSASALNSTWLPSPTCWDFGVITPLWIETWATNTLGIALILILLSESLFRRFHRESLWFAVFFAAVVTDICSRSNVDRTFGS